MTHDFQPDFYFISFDDDISLSFLLGMNFYVSPADFFHLLILRIVPYSCILVLEDARRIGHVLSDFHESDVLDLIQILICEKGLDSNRFHFWHVTPRIRHAGLRSRSFDFLCGLLIESCVFAAFGPKPELALVLYPYLD